jgi:hypothetical protein
MPFELDVSALQRLEKFLQNKNQPREITLLTPDASVREYFRVRWNNRTAIACVYPEPFDAREQTYLDVTRLFRESDLPVAEIYDYDESAAVIVQEDLGDVILRSVLEQAEYAQKNELLNRAILLIAKIQAATPRAFALDSIASRLKFDREKLGWELDFFKTHYFETYLKKQLTVKENKNLTVEFAELVAELENRAEVLCHRDFHAANLMIDTRGDLRIIDHQDARIGAASYDLVSILLDRILEEPSIAWLREKRLFFLEEREKAGLKHIDPDDFALEFRLQTIQRCLKHFIQYIEPMFRVVLQAARRLERFPHLQIIIERQLNEKSI